ncbi:MAG TPA: hypothetical protein VMC84_04725 [Methanocella sp.]|uniref:DUF7544 domain-containing protein n=1 Tax=Methanocella sp. TaxID=2052833 RepID=UPI002BDA26D1|nr:hypothetical protein [Methanocella sp.]HTY90461.1 hypothetical protein [Methanocella sp.]
MTEWWAFKPISTAFEKTKKLLLEPFNAWTWLKLMVIVFFVGIGSGRIGNQFSNTMNYNTGSSDASNIRYAINSLLSNPAVITMLIIAAVLIVIVALIFAYLRNVFSFVLIRDLASGDVHVIKPMMENLGRGLRLFVFTLVAGIFTLAVVLAFIVVVVLAVLLAIKMGTASAAGIIATILAICLICLLILLMIIFCVTMGIFIGFTYDFVAPMVYFKGMGIVESWKWLWASIKKNWQQYGVYVITRWVLELGVGIVSLIILVPVSLIFIAVLVLGGLAAAAAVKTSIAITVLIGLVLLVVLALFILAILAISMPIAVYFRYYSLDVLRHIDPSAVAFSERFTPPPPTLPA